MNIGKESKITIGCDPEFGLVGMHGLVANAQHAFSGAHPYLGWDHGGSVAEIRPPASRSPIGLVSNIKTIIKESAAMSSWAGFLKWSAGSAVKEQPIGGHIHFGAITSCETLHPNGKYFYKVLHALDSILAPIGIALEHRNEAATRRSGDYGHLGDFRPQDWGFEYRPLSSWLVSPEIAVGILSLAFIIVNEYDNDELMKKAEVLPRMQERDYNRADQCQIYRAAVTAINFAEKLPLYNKLYRFIFPIFWMVGHKIKWDTSKSMLDTWRIIKSPLETMPRNLKYV